MPVKITAHGDLGEERFELVPGQTDHSEVSVLSADKFTAALLQTLTAYGTVKHRLLITRLRRSTRVFGFWLGLFFVHGAPGLISGQTQS